MIAVLGELTLFIALGFALIQSIFPPLGFVFPKTGWVNLSRFAAIGQWLFLGVSYLCLTTAFINSDFSILYVAAHSNSLLPLFYRITAVWGGHEGSLLLWILLLSTWGCAVAILSRRIPKPLLAQILSVIGVITSCFLLFLLMTSDPFLQNAGGVPVAPSDLNPLLQDPGLAIHPPMLYLGYVGFAVTFAFAVAGLINGQFDKSWASWARPWCLAAWGFLTLGIMLGSWWAYHVLGWGGWWFWDPVENAALLPWLSGTALLHSITVVEKRNCFKAWAVLLSILTFSLSLLGTFLVRSGVLISVHSFAADPGRGVFMLILLLLVIGASLLLFAWRGQRLASIGRFTLISRETLLLTNNLLFVVATATVLLGTIYPLLLDAFNQGVVSVGPPYFNAVFVPLMLPLLFFMGMGPRCSWQSMSARFLLYRLSFAALVSLLFAVAVLWLFTLHAAQEVFLGVLLAVWVLVLTLQEAWRLSQKGLRLRQWGMIIAHVGMAVLVIGVTLASTQSVERDVQMTPGDQMSIDGYVFALEGLKLIPGPNYKAVGLTFAVSEQGKAIGQFVAEKRIYVANGEIMSQAAIKAGLWRDIYIALGAPLPDGSWTLRIYIKPFVRWIWFGGLMMALGALFSICDRRRLIVVKENTKI